MAPYYAPKLLQSNPGTTCPELHLQQTNLCAKTQAFERAVLSTHFIFDPIVDAYWACMPSEGGIKNSVEVLQDKVNVPPITMKDMERATWDAKKTGGDEYHSRFEAFASEFGSNIRPTED